MTELVHFESCCNALSLVVGLYQGQLRPPHTPAVVEPQRTQPLPLYATAAEKAEAWAAVVLSEVCVRAEHIGTDRLKI